jgi:HSP20 family protein
MTVRSLVPRYWVRRSLPVRRVNGGSTYSIDRLFDHLFNDFGSLALRPFGEPGKSLSNFNPKLDVSETETEVKVTAELPGLDEDDIEVSLTHNILTISGEKKTEKEDKNESYYHIERSYGAFKRSVALPSEVEGDQVEAIFKNGVLTVALPKTAEAQSKKIDIKAD